MPTTTFLLVRHGSHDRLDHVLCGRMEGVALGVSGRAEVGLVAERLAGEPIVALYASPLQRTVETAEIISGRLKLSVELEPALIELDFGDWTGAQFGELDADSRWQPWNSRRSFCRPPSGETLGEAQMRAVRVIEAICAAHPDKIVALVSHSDIIKALVCHYLGLNLDFVQRFEIDPASVSTLVVGDWGAKVLRLNEGAAP